MTSVLLHPNTSSPPSPEWLFFGSEKQRTREKVLLILLMLTRLYYIDTPKSKPLGESQLKE